MTPDLTDDDKAILVELLRETIEGDRFPLSPCEQPAPRKERARRARADSKPAAKRLERGSNARFVEEVLRALAPEAVRPAEIRAALQRDKVVSLAFTSIRHALGQLEVRKAVEQDGNGGWRIA